MLMMLPMDSLLWEKQVNLYKVNNIVIVFENMPTVNYDPDITGWSQIYNGILSPFATKYKVYIKSELKQRVENKKENETTMYMQKLKSRFFSQ